VLNKNLKLITVTVIILFCFGSVLKAQDPDFSQFYNTPLYYNPANVGLYKGLKARFNYRRQWVNIPGDFKSYNFSIDIADRDIPGAGGIGFLVNSDKEGIGWIKSTTIGILPAVRIPITSNFIMQVGAMISVVHKKIDWDKLIFSDQLSAKYGNISPSSFTSPTNDKITYPDFSFGGIFQLQGEGVTGNLGFAAHHITRPVESFVDASTQLDRKYIANLDIIFEIGPYKGYFKRKKGFKLNPGIFYQNQANMNLYSIGMNLYLTSLYFGIWYRNESLEYDVYSNFLIMAGVYIPFTKSTRMKFMYSYDMQITASNSYTGPSHEISLIFELDDLKLMRLKQNNNLFRGRALPKEALECTPF
jgi:type IX secretion system PorP/SprF family membrane protein